MHLSGDGRLLVIGRLDEIKVLDAATGTLLNTIESPGVDVLQTLDDGEFLIAGDADGGIAWCNLRFVGTSRRHLVGAAITGDKKALADLWFERRWGKYRSSITVATDGMSFVHSRPYDIPRLVDLRTRSLRWPIGKCVHFLTVASGDLRWWLSQSCEEPLDGFGGFDRRALQLWDATTGEPIHTFDASSLEVKAMALSEDATTAVTCMDGNPPQFWHIDWELKAHEATTPRQALERIRTHLTGFLDTFKRGSVPIEAWTSDDAGRRLGKAYRQQRSQSAWHWSDAQLDDLMACLGRLGFGFLSKDTVRLELERLRREETA